MFVYVSMGTRCGCQRTASRLSFFFASLGQLACELLLLLSLPPSCRSSRITEVPSSASFVWILRMLAS